MWEIDSINLANQDQKKLVQQILQILVFMDPSVPLGKKLLHLSSAPKPTIQIRLESEIEPLLSF